MEQRKSTPEGHSGTPAMTTTPPAWMPRTAPYSPDRRAKMLEHGTRQIASAAAARICSGRTPLPGRSAKDILGDLIGYAVVFGILALLFQSRIPLYLGAFVVLTDADRIESALATIGIRFEPETIGPDIVKRSAFLFGWFALLAALKGSVPARLAPWMPSAESWSFIAGIALLLAIVEALTALAMRRALPPLGLRSAGTA